MTPAEKKAFHGMPASQVENAIAREAALALQQHFESKKLLEAWDPGHRAGVREDGVLRPIYTYTASFQEGPQRSIRLCLVDAVVPGDVSSEPLDERVLCLVATKGDGADSVSFRAGKFRVAVLVQGVRKALYEAKHFCASNEEAGEDTGCLVWDLPGKKGTTSDYNAMVVRHYIGNICMDENDLRASARKVLTGWIDENHCSMRCIAGTDPSIISNRVAFIEKTPRIRIAPYTPYNDAANWSEGPKGSAPEYGHYEPSRDWCDAQLTALGYVLGHTETQASVDVERPRG